jgi:hypothetical protein
MTHHPQPIPLPAPDADAAERAMSAERVNDPGITPDDCTRLLDVVRELERLDRRLLGRGDVGRPVREALRYSLWAALSAREATDA